MLGVWLEHGLDQRGSLVHIADAPERGKSSLRCPYCQGALLARKGSKIAWHFAHAGESCAPSLRRDDAPILPLYHDFSLGLTPKDVGILRAVDVRGYADNARHVSRLAGRGLCQWNPYRGRGGGYELTNLGKIPFGQLSLYLFSRTQESLIENRMSALRKKAKTGDPVAQADLRIFRAQVKRIHANTLYFLEIKLPDKTLHKIGVTTRAVQERIAEVLVDLRAFFDNPAVKVLGTWPGHGGVEPYFKFKHKASNFPIGQMTEYFLFADFKAVLRDMRRWNEI